MSSPEPYAICFLMLLYAQGCGGTLDVSKARFTRADDARALRLKHLRLWTNGGYPLWLEVQVPRPNHSTDEVTLVFTTNISARPRFAQCTTVALSDGTRAFTSDDIHYTRTPIEVDADLGATGRHYHERGVVEDVEVALPKAQFARLVHKDAQLAGHICHEHFRLQSWQVDQMHRMLGKPGAQRLPPSANGGAATQSTETASPPIADHAAAPK
ncbi:MAG: hypothetical protein OXU20_08215 [Myxococcales bacterium]|nr:hypothetical protein [Myxococcales bacterium]